MEKTDLLSAMPNCPDREIGGYLELELPRHDLGFRGFRLNSGRNCLKWILETTRPRRVFVPEYACRALFEPLEALGIPYHCYSIDQNLELDSDIEPATDELLLYINYFGIKDRYCHELATTHREQLILDCSQALYYSPDKHSHTFFSPRKFVGLPDGGLLHSSIPQPTHLPTDKSSDRMAHLFQRIDEGANAGYDTFRKNELTLDGRPLMAMSHLTSRLLESIDFGAVRIARNRNFTRLHDVLGDHNLLQLDSNLDCPLVYPFFSENPALRDRLIRSRVYVPIYWPNVLATSCVDSMEYKAAFGIVPLPIDQRYDISDMDRILEVIHGR